MSDRFKDKGSMRYPRFTYTDHDGDVLEVGLSDTQGGLSVRLMSGSGEGYCVMVQSEDRAELEKRIRELVSKAPCGHCNGKGWNKA